MKPMAKVKIPIMNQLFFVYSKVLPRIKYVQLIVKRTTSMFEY
jgi:hypothetical protein